MSPGAEQRDDAFPDEGGDPFAPEPPESIDGNLLAGMPDDDRFASGVPEGQRANSLDFIQMTGLTRAPVRDPAPADTPSSDDLDPAAPLSFYEKGVTDVDDSSGGGTTGLEDALLDTSLIPDKGGDTLHASGSFPSAEAFKDIVAGLEAAEKDLADVAPARDSEPQDEDAPPEERTPSGDLLAILDSLEHGEAATPADAAGEANTEPQSTPADSTGNSVEDGPRADPAEDSAPMAGQPDADANALTDDWDALLDSVAAEPERPAPSGDTAAPGSGRHDALAEAEQLMHTLGQRQSLARPVPEPRPAPLEAVPSLLPRYTSTQPTSVELDADLPFDYSATPTRRRSKRHSRAARRGKKIAKLLGILMLLGGIGAATYFPISRALEQADDLETQAARLETEGKYAEASRVYDRLAGRLGANPSGQAEALFRSAYVLSLGEPRSGDEKNRRYRTALNQFASFVETFPQHPKRTRALTIMGRLHYELGEYDEAISILRDRANPSNDPQAALAMLRYLARSYSQKGDYEAAESAYLQAATLPGNYSVDQDYYALGEMFKVRANLAKTEAQALAFKKTAAEYWNRAVQVPGIEPSRKAELKDNLNWLIYQDGEELRADDTADAPGGRNEPPSDVDTQPPAPEPGNDAGALAAPEPGVGDYRADPAAELPVGLTEPDTSGQVPPESPDSGGAQPPAE